MSRHRSTTAKFIFSIFTLFALYISILIDVKNHTKVFIALTTPFWHALANFLCAMISSFRFSESDKHYFEIKNKTLRKIFMRPVSIEGVDTTSSTDKRTNIIGFILHIINIVLFVSFEVLLLLPEISCDPYAFTFVIGTRPRNYEHIALELDSLNEVIVAEGSRAYAFIMTFVFLIFVVIFNRKIKEHRKSIERNTVKTPTQKSKRNRGLEDIKYPKKLKIYFALSMIGIVLMFAFIFITWGITENIELLPKALQNEYIIFGSFAVIEITDIVLSFVFAFKVKKIRKETKEKYEQMCFGLHSELINIAVRKNNKKLKFWYDKDQLEQIENLVKASSENAELKLETKGNKIVSFMVIDTLNNSLIFTGYFI